MSLLAILDESPRYGLALKNEFESRTGWVWTLNVGQVYTTLGRLERDGLVRALDGAPEGQKVYEITEEGRGRVSEWFDRPTPRAAPNRDELVLKLVMAFGRSSGDASRVIQRERKAAVELLQEYTRLKRSAPADADLSWLFLLDSLIFQTEARVRWLDTCEARLERSESPGEPRRQAGLPIPPFIRPQNRSEVNR